MRDTQLPTISNILEQFINHHGIVRTPLVERDSLAIYWTFCANHVLQQGYKNAPLEKLTREPTIGLLFNMLSRTFEHAEGAVSSYATGCTASSEVVARAALEASSNLLYILAGDKLERLNAYFRSYLENVDDQVDKWLRTAEQMSQPEARIHEQAALRRRKANDELKSIVTRMMADMGLNQTIGQKPRWPNIADRFKALGMASTHRTVYARMCSQAHNDAEDTLTYFIAMVSGEPRLHEKLALETVNFSRLLVYFAVSWYLLAAIAYVEYFGFTEAERPLKMGRDVIEKEMEIISEGIGAT